MQSADVHQHSGRRCAVVLLLCLLPAVPLSAQTNTNAALDVAKGTITIPHAPALDLAPSLTLEAWVKPSAPDSGSFGAVIDKDHPYGFGLGVTSIAGRTDSVDATVILAGTAFTGPRIASDGLTWAHLAVTVDTMLHQLVFHLNGVPANAVTDARVRFPNTTQNLRIGRSTLGDVFRGMCDEIRLWNVVRTAPDIAVLWNHEAKGNEPGLVAVYHFEDVRDTVAWNRAAGGGLHGMTGGVKPFAAVARSDAFIDEHEYNGCYAAATPVAYGSSLKTAAIAPADTDCYKLWTRAGDVFRVESAAKNPGEPADLAVSVFSVDSLLHITTYLGGYPRVWSAASVPGYRFIQVVNRGSAAASYTLTITRRDEVFTPDEHEPNNSFAGAVARPWGVTSYGTIFPGIDAGVAPRDSDYYAYTARAGEIGLFIYAVQGISCGSGYVTMWDGSGRIYNTFDSYILNHRFTADGTYYLRIVPNEATYRYYFGGFKVLADIHDMLYDAVTVGAGTVLRSGIRYAYSNAYSLRINGETFSAAPDYAATELDGRQLVFGPMTMSGLNVTRKFFVPTAVQGDTLGFVRIQDILANTTGAPITVKVAVSSRLGANPSKVIGSSSGDTLFTTADTWLWTDDAYPTAERPNLVHIIDGVGGRDRVDSASLSAADLYWEWRDVTIQPGGKSIYLYYTSQDSTPLTAGVKGPAFSVRPYPAAATLGLGVEGSNVMNWPTDALVSAEVEERVPPAYALEQNYPNPFNPGSDIRYQLSEFSIMKLVVYDVLGREVAVLHDGPAHPGAYTVRFDGTGLASGVYLYRMTAGPFTQTRRMVLLR